MGHRHSISIYQIKEERKEEKEGADMFLSLLFPVLPLKKNEWRKIPECVYPSLLTSFLPSDADFMTLDQVHVFSVIW